MPKSKIILAIGALVALLPFFGFPHAWESVMEVVFGLSIVLLSVLISVDRRLSVKARVQKRQARKNIMNDANPEVQFGRRASDRVTTPEGTPAVRFGRRATDVVVPIAEIPDDENSSITL